MATHERKNIAFNISISNDTISSITYYRSLYRGHYIPNSNNYSTFYINTIIGGAQGEKIK